MKTINFILLFAFAASTCFYSSCKPGGKSRENATDTDTVKVKTQDTAINAVPGGSDSTAKNDKTILSKNRSEGTQVMVYYFHVTNRCPSCMAIEKATKKTLDTHFKNEVKQGSVKLTILNVDDEANKAISEKYQVYGSSLIIARVCNGKETTTDMTGDGFKYARNKEEKFIELLKNQVAAYLK